MNHRVRTLLTESCKNKHTEEMIDQIINVEEFARRIVIDTMRVVAKNLPKHQYLKVADAVTKHFNKPGVDK